MDSESGLDYIIENKEFISKFAAALATNNVTVKKQIFELLSAMCVYSPDGYSRAIESLEHYKTTKKLRYRFSALIDELRKEDNVSYKATLLGFINCIIIYTKDIEDRVRIRNEFIGLKVVEVLNQLREIEDQDPDLTVQLYVFDSHKSDDDEELPGPKGVDLNNPMDVFHAVYKQVCDTPQEVHFLSVLRHLLQIDTSESHSDIIWQLIEKLVHKAALVEKEEDSKRILTSITRKFDSVNEGKCECHCHKSGEKISRHKRNKSKGGNPGDMVDGVAPEPPVTNSQIPVPPPPEPPPPPGITPPPPPPSFGGTMGPPRPPGALQIRLPQQNIPKPKSKMRTLQWQKIPANKVVQAKESVWKKAGSIIRGCTMDFDIMDELFSLKTQQLPVLTDGTLERKKREKCEVLLLDGKRNLNVNIFLKQFKLSNEEIVSLLRKGAGETFGADRLKGLLKIIPDKDEIDVLKSFQGDKTKLGTAEKFFLELLSLPNYKLRIEGLLIKEEFASHMDWIGPALDSVIEAAKDIKENTDLHQILCFVLLAGNYLNSGNYAGDAAGFKLSSLLKITETRANIPRMNLLHFVVMQAEKKTPDMLTFTDKLKSLKDAAQVSIESIFSDVNALVRRVKNVGQQLDNVGPEFKAQMQDFLKYANEECFELQEDLRDVENLRVELSDFFCEEAQTFKLEDCIRTLKIFCDKFTRAVDENNQRKIQDDKAAAKQNMGQSDQGWRRGSVSSEYSSKASSPEPEEMEDGSIVDMLLADVRSGFASRTVNDGNFSVKKVHKVNLNDVVEVNEPKKGNVPKDFVRGGYGRVSMRKLKYETMGREEGSNDSGKSAKSSDNRTDGDLLKILMQAKEPSSLAVGDEFNSDMYGSFRRKRAERREKKSILDPTIFDRERASSPSTVSDSEKLTNSNSHDPPVRRRELPKARHVSDTSSTDDKHSPLRRTQSFMDRRDIDRALAKSEKSLEPETGLTKSVDTETGVERARRRLLRKAQRESVELEEQNNVNNIQPTNIPLRQSAPDPLENTPEPDPSLDKDQRGRTSARWRSHVISDNHELQPIQEKEKLDTSVNLDRGTSDGFSLERSRDQMSRRYRKTMDPAELTRMINVVEKMNTPQYKTVEDIVDVKEAPPAVSVSVKTKLNRRWHTDLGKGDIDQVMRAIEDAGQQIDASIGNSSELLNSTSQEQNATPTAVCTAQIGSPILARHRQPSPKPQTEVEQDLAMKRQKRKMRSELSLDDVHLALTHPSPSTPESTSSATTPTNETSTFPSDESIHEKKKEDRDKSRLTGRRKFRNDRFGEKENDADRARSNVEMEQVEQAYKEYVNGSMSRSKSWDDAKSEKAEFTLHKDSSNPEMGDRKRRSGSAKLLASRRHGCYIPSNDSDSTEDEHEHVQRRRKSNPKCDKNDRSSSQSTSTSTETLKTENTSDIDDSSPELSRRSTTSESMSNMNDLVNANNEINKAPLRVNLLKQLTGETPVNRNSLIYENVDSADVGDTIKRIEIQASSYDDDSPSAQMARWRLKRLAANKNELTQDTSDQNGNISPRARYPESNRFDNVMPHTILHKTDSSGDYRSDVSSRGSIASDRDEGFESQSQSGTISQRTSLCSAADDIPLTPTFQRKEFKQYNDINTNNIILVNNLHNVAYENKDQVDNWKKQSSNSDRDSLLDSSHDYSMTSESKEEGWQTSPKLGLTEEFSPQATSTLENKAKLSNSQSLPTSPTSKTPTSPTKKKKVPTATLR